MQFEKILFVRIAVGVYIWGFSESSIKKLIIFMPATKKVSGYYVIPSEILSVRPSVSAPTIRLPATPPTVLGQSF